MCWVGIMGIDGVSRIWPVYPVKDVPGLYQLTVTSPLPPFFVNADSKGLKASRKPFRMNTCGGFMEVFILKGLRGKKNR